MATMDTHLQCDVLIIGCGIAGGIAALRLAEWGLDVVVVTQAGDPLESNTYYAQGGIIYRGEDDSPEKLGEDIHRAGAGDCNPTAVKILSEEGPRLVREILMDKLGVVFDRDEAGNLSLGREGGHSMPRILHVADKTGKAIQEKLIEGLAASPNIKLLRGFTAIDLLTPSHHSQNRLAVYDPVSCAGAYLLDHSSNEVICCLAGKTVLATGGLGQIFLRTSNPAGARGDGFAMAYRAGARLINCEYIQFHPTTFHHRHAPHFLISEAVRGAGARLINDRGEPFMRKYAPEWQDLAPRDVVARGIHEEMQINDVPNLYLDMASYLSAEDIQTKFPTIYQTCLSYNIDATREPIPIVPAAHYSCGGIWVDDCGKTTIDHLYAVGEVACTGLHGANRLASTSLLEGLVWGDRAAFSIRKTLDRDVRPRKSDYPSWVVTGDDIPDPTLISQDMQAIKNIMWNYVGLVRTTPRLVRALRELRNLENEIEQFYRTSRLNDSLVGLRNAVRTAIIITLAAWRNKTSRGCHYRE